MLHHDFNFLRNIERVQPDPAHDALHGGAAIDFFLCHLRAVVRQLEGQLVRRVVLQHVQNELFFNRLAHGINMKRRRDVVGCRFARRVWASAKQLHRLVLGRGGKGHESDAAIVSARSHLRRQNVF